MQTVCNIVPRPLAGLGLLRPDFCPEPDKHLQVVFIIMDLSIVIPIYNEEANIPRLYARVKEVMAAHGYHYELIFVDDGSQDHSLELLQELLQEPGVRIVQLTRNFGQHPALAAGLSVAQGKYLITMDADLQIDPGYIPALVDKLKTGADFVSGIRKGRQDNFFLRRLPSRLMNFILGLVLGRQVQDFGCPLNGLRQELAGQFSEYAEMQRFLKPLALRLAQDIQEVEVGHEPRKHGASKYRFINLVDLFFDFVTNFSRHIFQWLMVLGLFMVILSVLVGIGYIGLRFVFPILDYPMERLLGLLFLGMVLGMQCVLLGILGEFVIRIYRRITPRQLYQIKKVWEKESS